MVYNLCSAKENLVCFLCSSHLSHVNGPVHVLAMLFGGGELVILNFEAM